MLVVKVGDAGHARRGYVFGFPSWARRVRALCRA
jgi:hypothetical protein